MFKFVCHGCGERESQSIVKYYSIENVVVKMCPSCCLARKQSDEILRKLKLDRAVKERESALMAQKSMAELQPENRLTKPVTQEQKDKQILKALLADLDHYCRTGEWSPSLEEAGQYIHSIKSVIYNDSRTEGVEEDVN